MKLSVSFPVPIHSSSVLKSSHFFISQVGDNLEHGPTITIPAEDLSLNVWLGNKHPPCGVGTKDTCDEPLCVVHVSKEHFFHY